MRRSWLVQFISEPDKVLAANDPIATALFQEFNSVPMPNLGLSQDQVVALLTYLDSQVGSMAAPTASPTPASPLSGWRANGCSGARCRGTMALFRCCSSTWGLCRPPGDGHAARHADDALPFGAGRKSTRLLAFTGFVLLIVRRLTHSKVRAVTTPMDWVVLVLLLNQVFLGLCTAFFYRWGAAWFIHTATPWVVSLATFRPQTETIVALPWVPKIHFLNATLLIAVVPFSRLVHLLAFPFTYLWRRLQGTIWNRQPTS